MPPFEARKDTYKTTQNNKFFLQEIQGLFFNAEQLKFQNCKSPLQIGPCPLLYIINLKFLTFSPNLKNSSTEKFR